MKQHKGELTWVKEIKLINVDENKKKPFYQEASDHNAIYNLLYKHGRYGVSGLLADYGRFYRQGENRNASIRRVDKDSSYFKFLEYYCTRKTKI